MALWVLGIIIFGGLIILLLLYVILNSNTPDDYVTSKTSKSNKAVSKRRDQTHHSAPYSNTPSYPDPSMINSKTSGDEWHVEDDDDPFGNEEEDVFDAYYRRENKKD